MCALQKVLLPPYAHTIIASIQKATDIDILIETYISIYNQRERQTDRQTNTYIQVYWLVGWLVGFYGISSFVGYLMPNLFLYK